ncbi:MAG: flagellar hook assembly protein FlgD [Rhodocyclaceae bacterium]|jgi:flagellar basal-body rod modification protein FlgD|nr:flagellar hook assembly protein FlgD [Rhodocyclaceae bacterium]
MAATSAVSDNPASAIYSALNPAAKATGNNQVTDQQSRFLRLLTTQLKNQDPLNPMDNAQMTSQMAQISTVDGITQLNATLQKLIGNAADTQVMQAASLVNHGVLVPGAKLDLQNGSAFAGVELSGPADQVTVTIKDGNGLVMRTLNLGAMAAGSHPFNWDGATDSGAAAANGNYSFNVAAVQGGNKVESATLALGLVTSAERTSAGLSLNVGSLGAFTLADVRQIL